MGRHNRRLAHEAVEAEELQHSLTQHGTPEATQTPENLSSDGSLLHLSSDSEDYDDSEYSFSGSANGLNSPYSGVEASLGNHTDGDETGQGVKLVEVTPAPTVPKNSRKSKKSKTIQKDDDPSFTPHSTYVPLFADEREYKTAAGQILPDKKSLKKMNAKIGCPNDSHAQQRHVRELFDAFKNLDSILDAKLMRGRRSGEPSQRERCANGLLRTFCK